jgi:hypothetical protein
MLQYRHFTPAWATIALLLWKETPRQKKIIEGIEHLLSLRVGKKNDLDRGGFKNELGENAKTWSTMQAILALKLFQENLQFQDILFSMKNSETKDQYKIGMDWRKMLKLTPVLWAILDIIYKKRELTVNELHKQLQNSFSISLKSMYRGWIWQQILHPLNVLGYIDISKRFRKTMIHAIREKINSDFGEILRLLEEPQ